MNSIIPIMSFPTMIRQAYMEMPPVTRAYTTACVLTTMSVQLELLSPFQLYFNPILIWRNLQVNFLFDVSSDANNGFLIGTARLVSVIFNHVSGVEDFHNIFVFRHIRVQLLFQHDIYISVLPNVGRKFIQRAHSGLRYNVFIWELLNGYICPVCQPLILR